DIENPQESVNVNSALGVAPKMISLRDKRPDQFYYLEDIPGTLRSANLKNRTISAPIVEEVIKYETYSDDIILYVTEDKAGAGKAEFRILEADKTYTLKQVTAAKHYILDVSRYDNDWYYVVGNNSD